MWHAECHNGLAASAVPAPIWYTHAHNTINGDSRICDKTFSMHACLTSQQSWQTSVTNLVEINHEGGEGQRNGLSGLDASEDLVHHADPGPLCRNKAANVCQKHYQTNLYWAGVLQCSRKFFTGQEHTTLSPLFVLHNSFSSCFFWTQILLAHYHHYDVAFWYHALLCFKLLIYMMTTTSHILQNS